MEVWKSVVGYEGFYEVSNLGSVRGVDRILKREKGPYLQKGQLLKQRPNPKGYLMVGLNKVGAVKKCVAVHRLVAEAFLGPKPDDLVTCHVNGNKTDNSVENLQYATQKENCSHKVIHGTHQTCEAHGMAKLKLQDVAEIKALIASGETQTSVAKLFGVHKGTISMIHREKLWRGASNA